MWVNETKRINKERKIARIFLALYFLGLIMSVVGNAIIATIGGLFLLSTVVFVIIDIIKIYK
jgi:hypothetical protein